MGIVFATKVFAQTLIDGSTYYTAPELNLLLGSAERYSVQVQTTHVDGGDPDVTVALHTSESGGTWSALADPIPKLAITDGTVLFGSALVDDVVSGRLVRGAVTLGGASPKAYVEIWIVGRDAH